MGFQDREYVRNRGRESASRPIRPVDPWRSGSDFRPWLLIGLLAVFGAGFVLGAIYGDWALSFIQGFA